MEVTPAGTNHVPVAVLLSEDVNVMMGFQVGPPTVVISPAGAVFTTASINATAPIEIANVRKVFIVVSCLRFATRNTTNHQV